ncbi:MAG: hypothetical protein OEY56_01620, partial [Cyclobacteriaceae bacterium]|nr:hypothetical protein [Cyclobacteriaceae bacterium]
MRKEVRVILMFFILVFIADFFAGAQTRTSVQSGNWGSASTWDCACVPGAAESVIISSGHTVTLNANASITNFTINSGGAFNYNGFTLTVTGTVTPFVSVQTGNWTTASTWLNGAVPGTADRAIVCKGHTVSTVSNTEIISDLTVSSGAVISTANNKDLQVTSKLTVNGTIKLNQVNADLIFATGPVTLSGSGTIDGSGSTNGALQVNANTTISSGSSLTFLNDIDIAAGILLTNNGSSIVAGGSITGASATSQMTMGTNSLLEIDGALLATGLLDAGTNPGNT